MGSRIYLSLPGCRIETIHGSEGRLVVEAHTVRSRGRCPNCHHLSSAVHSYYTRSIDDLPLSGSAVQLRIRVKRFRCLFTACRRRTFTEAIPDWVVGYSRRTARLNQALWHIGQVAGGQAGARLATHLSMPTSRPTLLRLLRRYAVKKDERLQFLGIDDWAKRRGQTYGTILVDLERHRVVDLLPDRDAETVSTWLSSKPDIQVVARDRSSEYAQGIGQGAPEAVQVADRWHLLKNLSEAVERALQDILPTLRKQTESGSLTTGRPRPNFPRSQAEKASQQFSREGRLQDYTRVQYLKQRGLGVRRISRLLGLHQATVSRYFKAETFPERETHYVASLLDPFLEYLEQRVTEGCWNGQQLWREISQLGYPGRPSQVIKWMQLKRQATGRETATPASFGPSQLPIALPPLRLCRHLLLSTRDGLSEEDEIVLAQLLQVPVLKTLYALAQTFRVMVRERQAAQLMPWLRSADASNIAACQRFAASLKQDYQAVQAALEFPWSNGQTEGQVNRLKTLKRQMYGRANLDLLRLRLLYDPA